jgi:Insertion element 4 transposase N-terminal/Transposase DDE domain
MPASQSSLIRQAVFSFVPRWRSPRVGGGAEAHPTAELGFGVISLFCPIELVERIVAECGRREQRVRLLPAHLVVYCVLMLCLFPDAGQQEVLQRVGLGSLKPRRWQVPHKSALIKAKARLGWQVMERLFRALAGPLATKSTEGAFWRGLRLMAVDGTTLEVSNTVANEEAFGGPTTVGRARTGNPQIRVAALAECGTHALIDAAMGRFEMDEASLMAPFARSLTPQMLVLADRGVVSAEQWSRFTATGAHLLWRASKTVATRAEEHLDDGSYLAVVRSSRNGQRRLQVRVRVVEYVIEGSPEVYRLITSLLDPASAPAGELARLYHERWEIEGTFDELKTHQRGPRAVLRSKNPEAVRQEFWGHMILHGIVRKLAHKASRAVPGHDPDSISFVSGLQVIRRSATSGTGRKASLLHRAVQHAVEELAENRRRVVRRRRRYPRVVGHQQPRYPSRRGRATALAACSAPLIFICGP